MDFVIDPEDEGKQNEEQYHSDPHLIIEINGLKLCWLKMEVQSVEIFNQNPFNDELDWKRQ